MNKYLIIAVAATVVLLLLGGVGFWGYQAHSELARYRDLGSQEQLQTAAEQSAVQAREYRELKIRLETIEREFGNYRNRALEQALFRSERASTTGTAAFSPLSGPYVVAATAVQEQLERCQDIQSLIGLEAELFGQPELSVLSRQDKVCNSALELKLMPLFKYQMLRVRASMSGSLGHLRDDADKQFAEARELLSKWQVPVSRELDSYTRF